MKYDVIIVGAGSAGCVLAARLSEDSHRSVLLLEAGPSYPSTAALPPEILSGLQPAYTHDWDYFSEPGLVGHRIHLVRAKLVGGCSATNATFALRGTPSDYDEWAARGNAGWGFAEILSFFRRLENDADYRSDWHSQDGPIPIRRYAAEDLDPIQRSFLEACATAGYSHVDDHNAPGALGAGLMPMNTMDGVRQSTASTYLAAASIRGNLSVRPGVLVDRVLFEGHRAVGIRLANPAETLWADHIILAAGTYSSPAILMRSGLGSADHLRTLGIPVLENLPGVGQNLIDHPLLGLHFVTASVPRENSPLFQTMLTLRSSTSVQDHDLQIFPSSALAADHEDHPGRGSFALLASVVKPLSRGEVRLRAPDPAAAPIVDLGYFTHPADMPRMIEVVRAARRLACTQPLSDLMLQEVYPGREVSDSDADLEKAIWARVETYHHPVGTCCMGPSTNSGAVVDSRGSVHGVEHLSVIDASIMPTIPAANTNLPTIMVAERCAAWFIEGERGQ